jgi:hypothetical protein
MLVGQQEEHLLRHRQEVVMPPGHRLLRQRQRHRIIRKGFSASAKQLPRELVENDDLRQSPFGRRAPAPGFTPRHRRMGLAKLRGDQRIEFGGRTEPVRLAVPHEPEVQNIACCLHAADVNGFGAGVMAQRSSSMNLIKLTTEDNPIYINPEFVVSVKKGMKDTAIQTVADKFTVKETVEMVVRLLGADEVARDITPALPKSIDL